MGQQTLLGVESEIPAMKFVICLLGAMVILSLVIKGVMIVVDAVIFATRALVDAVLVGAKFAAIVLAVSLCLYIVLRGLIAGARQIRRLRARRNPSIAKNRSAAASSRQKLATAQHRTDVASRRDPEPVSHALVTSSEDDSGPPTAGEIGSEMAMDVGKLSKAQKADSSDYIGVARGTSIPVGFGKRLLDKQQMTPTGFLRSALLSSRDEIAEALSHLSGTVDDSPKESPPAGKEVAGLLTILAEPHDPLDADIRKLGAVENAEFSKSLQIVVGCNNRIECNTRYRAKKLQIDLANFSEDISPQAKAKLSAVVDNPDDSVAVAGLQSALRSMIDQRSAEVQETLLTAATAQNLQVTTRRCAVIVESNGSHISSNTHHTVAVGELDIVMLLSENANLISDLGRFLHEPNSQSKDALDTALAGAVTDRHLETLLTGATFDKECPRIRGVSGNFQADRVPVAVIDPTPKVTQNYSIKVPRLRTVGTSQLINHTEPQRATFQHPELPSMGNESAVEMTERLRRYHGEPPKKSNRKGISI